MVVLKNALLNFHNFLPQKQQQQQLRSIALPLLFQFLDSPLWLFSPCMHGYSCETQDLFNCCINMVGLVHPYYDLQC